MRLMNNQKYYRIGEISKWLDISPKVIRLYEKKGLILPEKTKGGQRLYNGADAHWINCIRDLVDDKGLDYADIQKAIGFLTHWDMIPSTQTKEHLFANLEKEFRPCWMDKEEKDAHCPIDNCRICDLYYYATTGENITDIHYSKKQSENR